VACALLLISLGAHAMLRRRHAVGRLATLSWTTLTVGIAAAALPVAGSFARPTGVVVRRNAPLLEAASPSADAVGTLRAGEVVPILERGGAYVRIEDSSGARGWVVASDVRPLSDGRR